LIWRWVRTAAQRTFVVGSESYRQGRIREKEGLPGTDIHNFCMCPRRTGGPVHKSGARTNAFPKESMDPEGNGRPSHSFRPSLRHAGSGGYQLHATYSNVLAGRVSTEKLEVSRDTTASTVVEIRSIPGLVNRQIRCLPPLSHSQVQGGRNHSNALFHHGGCTRVSLPSSGIGAFNGLKTADWDALTKTLSTCSPTSR
jgi:hypothetical protein